MSKFKKCDLVLVAGKSGIWNCFNVGDLLEVCGVFHNPNCRRISDGATQYVSDCDLVLAGEEKIVVTRKGNVTTARWYAGRSVVKSAEAKCSSKDEFNFETGAALTLDRLLGRQAEAPAPVKMYPLEDIKAGYLLKVRDDDGAEYFMTVVPGSGGELACCCPGKHWWPLHHFGSELRYGDSCVLAVYSYTCNSAILANSTEGRKLLWSRN